MVRENSPYGILVEGSDDRHSVIHLLRRHGIDWESGDERLPWVHSCGGLEPLLESIGVSVKSYGRLGMVVDANLSLESRWAQIKGRLEEQGISLGALAEPEGAIVGGVLKGWQVGVWIMPDNVGGGKLEDFLARLVPDGDACWRHAGGATAKAKEIGAVFAEKDQLKAQLHAWLAWQENPGLPFGTAIKAAYLGHESVEAKRFVRWFRRLFCGGEF